MQISSIGQSSTQLFQASPAAPRSEEAAEVASGPQEEAREAQSIVKSAEQDRGMATKIDILA